MIKKVKDYLSSILKIESDTQKADPRIAVASLLCAVAYADHDTSAVERDMMKDNLIKQLCITEQQADQLLVAAEQDMLASTSIFDFTSLLSELSHEDRLRVIEMMWQVAYADNHLDEIEEAIIRRVAGLLYIPHSEFIRLKLKVLATISE